MEQKLYARYFIGLLLFGVALTYFSTIRFAISPLILGALLTVVLVPISNKLMKLGLSKNLSSFLSIGALVVLLLIVVYIMTMPLLKSTKSFLISLPTFLMGIQNRLGLTKIFSTLGIMDAITQGINTIISEMIGIEKLVGYLMGTIKWLYLLFLTPIFTFYLLRDRWEIQKSITYLIPFNVKGEIGKVFKEIYTGITTYVYGYLFISLMCMGLSLLAFSIIDLNSYLFLAFFMGACSFIPFVGPIIGGIPAIIVAASYGWKFWYVVVAVLLIFQFAGSILTPRTIGNSVNIHPIFGILAMVLGYGLFGVAGVLLAVPIFVVVKPIAKYAFTIFVN